jgi:hypothetical protein
MGDWCEGQLCQFYIGNLVIKNSDWLLILMVIYYVTTIIHTTQSQYWIRREKTLWLSLITFSIGLLYPIFLLATLIRAKRKKQALQIEESGLLNWLVWLLLSLGNLTFAWLFLAFSVTDKAPLRDQPVTWIVGCAVAIPLAGSAHLMFQRKFLDGLKCSAYTLPFLFGLVVLFGILLS